MSKQLGPRALARQRRILDAASRLFIRKGIEHTTVEDLLAEAGIARATFYRAFPSLNAVIEALYAEYEQHVVERLAEQLERIHTADMAGLTAIIDGALDDQGQRAQLVRVMYREELRPGGGEIWQRKRVARQLQLLHQWWESTTGLVADDELIFCLIMLLQNAGLMVAEPERSKRLRKALVFVFQAVVRAYVESKPAPATGS